MMNSLPAVAPAAATLSVSTAPNSAAADAPSAAAPVEDAAPATAPPPAAKAVSLSVDRDTSGVFVYTLTDTASGRVLAVIPRSAMATGGSGVDMQA